MLDPLSCVLYKSHLLHNPGVTLIFWTVSSRLPCVTAVVHRSDSAVTLTWKPRLPALHHLHLVWHLRAVLRYEQTLTHTQNEQTLTHTQKSDGDSHQLVSSLESEAHRGLA